MNTFDPRTTPARPDLAAAHLAGKVEAARFVEGRPMHLGVELAELRAKPSLEASVDTQVLFGEPATLYDAQDGWAWVQLETDRYVGYLPFAALAEGFVTPTHVVRVNRTFVYPRPDIKAPSDAGLSLGARLRVESTEGNFARLADGGYIFAQHLMPYGEKAADFVAVAEALAGAPYLWGGKSLLGIDCSGLVQVALAQAGVGSPRDTDLQQKALGTPLPIAAAEKELRRGDLVFWKGHVGIMRDRSMLLHANAHHMLVASEPLREARARILAKGAGDITALKRL
jgi:cell wall-associated NlpC family hydrolase